MEKTTLNVRPASFFIKVTGALLDPTRTATSARLPSRVMAPPLESRNTVGNLPRTGRPAPTLKSAARPSTSTALGRPSKSKYRIAALRARFQIP